MALGYWQNNILMPFLLPIAINYRFQRYKLRLSTNQG